MQRAFWLALALACIICVLDFSFQLPHWALLLYSAAALPGLWFNRVRYIFVIGYLLTSFIVLASFSPHHPIAFETEFVERIPYLLSIWICVFLIIYNKTSYLKFWQAFENATSACVIANAHGIVKASNPAADKMFGYQAGEMIGKNISILMPPEMRHMHQGFIDMFLRTGKKNIIGTGRSLQAVHKDGSYIPIQLGISELHSISGISFMATMSDLTELTQALTQAQEANIAKSQFLANMSHELRTPLNAVIGFSDIILSQPTDGSNKDQTNEYVEIIKTSGQQLLKLINGILDISRIEMGEIEEYIEETEIHEILKNLVDITTPIAGKRGLKVLIANQSKNSVAEVDEKLVRQVFSNILENAVKFTESGTIEVILNDTAINDEEALAVSIKDTGIGIPDKKIDLIFNRFEQVENAYARQYEGAGLGLTICKEIAARMRGEILVESELGKGSTFTFVFPKKQK